MSVIRVAGYCRVSTDREDQANSFAAQCRYFREYIGRNPQWQLHEIYADEGITGTSTKNRIRFNQMIDDAYASKFQLILTKEVSRFSRNILDTIRYTRELKQLGIGVLFMTDGIYSLEPDAELRLSIMGSIAQEESRKTSARVKWGQLRQMERGIVFGHSLLGYNVKGGVMSIDPIQAKTVERIFREYALDGKSTAQIARGLERDGVLTGSGSCVWRPSYIIKLLKNEKYVGDLVQKKTVTTDYLTHRKKYNHGEEALICIQNHHTPIVTRALWDAAQERMAMRVRKSGSKGGSDRHLLSGKIRCVRCGKNLVAHKKKRKNGSIYRCWSCCGIQIGQVLVMQMIQRSLKELKLDEGRLIGLIRKILSDATKATGQVNEISDEMIRDIILTKPEALCEAVLDEVRIDPGKSAEIRFRELPHVFKFRLVK